MKTAVERDTPPDNFIARLEDLLEEAAMQGAILVEVRFGGETMLRPDYLALFREAERRVQTGLRVIPTQRDWHRVSQRTCKG